MTEMRFGSLNAVRVIQHAAGEIVRIGGRAIEMNDGTILVDGRDFHMTERDYETLKASPDVETIG